MGSSEVLSSSSSTGLTAEMQQPTQVTAYDVTDNEATITWFPPEEHFRCIDEYEVAWYNKDDPNDLGSVRVDKDIYIVKIGK